VKERIPAIEKRLLREAEENVIRSLMFDGALKLAGATEIRRSAKTKRKSKIGGSGMSKVSDAERRWPQRGPSSTAQPKS
jgi:hypothetical protein